MSSRKLVSNLVADDKNLKIDISIRLSPEFTEEDGGLTREEIVQIKKELMRGIASVLPGLSYTDFGIENTKIT